jgi:hypothetical protein
MIGGARVISRNVHGGTRVLHVVRILAIAFFCAVALVGCDDMFEEKKPKPTPVEYTLMSPYKGVHNLAVAPAINLSGNRDFDVLTVSDALFEELQQVGGFNVLPLNKTLAAMRRLQIQAIDSSLTAQKLAEFLEVDCLVIPSVTAYDPYNPPKMGMILQLYTPRRLAPGSESVVVSDHQPVSQVAAVFNASNQTVLRELRDFSQGRTQYDSALQDERFLMDADAYTRFVCHAMVRRMIEVERVRAGGR